MIPRRSFPSKLRRPPGKLKDSSLIVIATEGQRTEKTYFENLAAEFQHRRVVVHVLNRLDNLSSPEAVLGMLVAFKEQYDLDEDDELWLVVDVDRWGQAKLAKIARQCLQGGISLAVSNPCFEIWLLLHLKDIGEYSPEEQDDFLHNSRDDTTRTRLERELIAALGRYNKANLNTDDFLPAVETAIQRARHLDVHPEHRWPNSLGSRVYLLAERIMGKVVKS
jgi:hypothetical protein